MDITPERLLAMTDDEFKEFVNRDTRSAVTDEERAALRDPTVRARWIRRLTLDKMSIESQLAARRSDLAALPPSETYDEALRKFHSWRASVIRVKNGIETRLIEARSTKGEQ